MEKKPESLVDVELLNKAFEAFNQATEKLQSSYELLQEEARKLREEVEDKNRRLSEVTHLLESVMNHSRSAILAVGADGTVLLKNRPAETLVAELGDEIHTLLQSGREAGMFEYLSAHGRYFRLSVGVLASEGVDGLVYVIEDTTRTRKLEQEKVRDEKLRLMGEMAANIAHEIRNPLGSIELFASLLGRDVDHDPDKKRLTASIVKGVRTINAIISNTLLFTKELQVAPQEYVLADIVDDVILYLSHLMREKSVQFKNRMDEEHTLICDAELMKQVVMNLIHNAIDAVPAGGVIELTSATDDSMTSFTVRDNGSGIEKDMQKRLFMPFQTTKAKGTGLGLSIVYKIVKAHGGDITVESDGESFTSFTVSIPRKA